MMRMLREVRADIARSAGDENSAAFPRSIGHRAFGCERLNHAAIIPPPLVRGHDLIALGLKPGPRFSEILEAVETRQLEGTLDDREEALAWVKTEFSAADLTDSADGGEGS